VLTFSVSLQHFQGKTDAVEIAQCFSGVQHQEFPQGDAANVVKFPAFFSAINLLGLGASKGKDQKIIV
jgi:hypothetical protein